MGQIKVKGTMQRVGGGEGDSSRAHSFSDSDYHYVMYGTWTSLFLN